MMNPISEHMIISLKYSSTWLEKQTHYKIIEDRVGCGELTTMVAVTKKHLH